MAREARPNQSQQNAILLLLATTLSLLLAFPVILAWIFAIIFSAVTPHCLLGFDSADTFVLPDFRYLSNSEKKALNDGTYKLPQDYYLVKKVANDNSYQLCVLTNPLVAATACMVIGRVNHSIPCSRDMKADCMPGAIIDSFFGLSVWNLDTASVQYLIMSVPDSGDVSSQNLTNTTNHFSDIWYRVLGCEGVIALDISCLVATVLVLFIIICYVISPVCVGCCYLKSKKRNVHANGSGSERAPLICCNVPPSVPPSWSNREQVLLQDVEEKVVPKVAADWESLAIYLGVEPTRIDIIKRSTHHQSEHSCREMFRSWLKKDRETGRQPRTRHSVVQAVRRMGREDLADQLRDK